VRPGDRVGLCDGKVVKGYFGRSMKAPLPAKSVAAPSRAGRGGVAGSINTEALLRVGAVPKAAADNTIARIVRSGRRGQKSARRAEPSGQSTGSSRIYMPAVVGLGCIGRRRAHRLPSEARGDGMGPIVPLMALLLIRLPCALVIFGARVESPRPLPPGRATGCYEGRRG